MLKKYSIWISAVSVLAGIFLFYFGTRSLITVSVDGMDRTVIGHGFTVGSALTSARVPFHAEDRILPGIDSLLPKSGKIQVISAKPFHILVQPGNVWLQVYSADDYPGNILLKAGIRLFPGDEIFYNGLPVSASDPLPLAADITLQFRVAQPITIAREGQNTTVYSGAFNLIQGLGNSGMLLNPGDQFSVPLDSALSGPSVITFNPAPLLYITYKGKILTSRSGAATVGRALAEAGIPLQDLDYTVPAEDQPVPPDGNIRVVAVTDSVKVNQIATPYGITTSVDNTVELDTTKVIAVGQYGLEVSRQHIFSEDGKETSRVTEPSVVLSRPVNAQVAYGGKMVVKTLDTPDGPIQYYRSLTVHATAFSPCEPARDGSYDPAKCDNQTAAGTKIRKGIIAVTYKWYLLLKYEKVYIPGYGINSIEDNYPYALPWKYWIDIGFDDSNYVPISTDVTIYFLYPPTNTPPVSLP
jgi:uncharacterized protein YabE (DUF348 family)